MIDAVLFNESGLVPVITQDAGSGQVLMFAWMDREALAETVRTGHAVYRSRSRGKLWRKGEESGHVQRVRELRLDCDGDVLLLAVEQLGGIACHTGRAHCFYRRLGPDGEWHETEPVLRSPASIYGDTPDAGERRRSPPSGGAVDDGREGAATHGTSRPSGAATPDGEAS